MTYAKAVKVAIEALKDQKKKYVVSANLLRVFGVSNPSNINADKKVKAIDKAIELLERSR